MWIPLHVHSQYSILDSSASVKDLADKAAEFEMPAVALTDHGNLFGAIEFYKACQEVNVQPILGCEFYVAPHSRLEKKKEAEGRTSFHLTLLAKNNEGYHNLCKLSSIGYLEGFYYYPRIDFELLKQYSKGLICLSGCLSSHLSHEILNGTPESTLALVQRYHSLFGEDYYLEIQRHPMSEEDLRRDGLYDESWLLQQYHSYIKKQERVNTALIEMSRREGVPLVATNDSHYMERSNWRSHEILLNIQSGEPCEIWEKDSQGNLKQRVPNPKRRTYPSHEIYFKSPQQMISLFSDLPEAIEQTLKISKKCTLQLDLKSKHYPIYIPPNLEGKEYTKEEQKKAVQQFLYQLCLEGIPKRYTEKRLAKVQEVYPGKDPLQVVRERLDYEMSVIAPKEMCDYLLIVWDFIHWAKQKGIPVGPGRGSGAGSILLYLIGVTDIEPLRFHLFFERFINPERISYPDIDVDICMDRRAEVIHYTLEKYGKENVAQIITFGTMKARMTIKDVGRALNVPLSKVNAIAKLVPDDLNITLEKALEKDPDLLQMYHSDEDARHIIDHGKTLEGSIRSTGIHAAGIIISGPPLTDIIPLCNAKDSEIPATQYSMKPVELVGMLKMDFLGLKTLTAIQICVSAIRENSGETIDWVDLPLDDAATFALLNQGKTLGIFQLESGGMQDLARNLHLDKFEEIIAVGALFRPGPMDMIPSFINRKHGREAIENDHPWMQDILAETYGIMVYQEQVMQIASKLAGFSLGEGDVLRRAMGKKDMEQMATQREKFRKGALENGIDEETSMKVFDKMEKFAAYGFNKSHAAAYGYLSYVTAFLKANYPKEWMSALMTCDRDDLSKVAKFILECQTMGIAILPPDVNESGNYFVATPQGIRFAMTGIKGVGEGVVDAILNERQSRGPFKDFYSFFDRMDGKKIGKKTIESLVDAGCFGFTGWSKDALRISIEPMFDAAAKEQLDKSRGVITFFTLMGESAADRFKNPPQVREGRSSLELLLKEKELLGFFLTGHPLDSYQEILKSLSCMPLNVAETLDHDAIFRTAFIVETVETRLAMKSQKKFAILKISNGIDHYELPVWPDLFEEKQSILQENRILYAVLQVDKKEENTRLSCKWLDDLTKANEAMVQACDQAYDRAKAQASRFSKQNEFKNKGSLDQTRTKMNSSTPSISLPASPQFLSIKLDLNQVRLSHILEIKKLVRNHRGTLPLQLHFLTEEQVVAVIHLDSAGGVVISELLSNQLKAIPAVLSLELGGT